MGSKLFKRLFTGFRTLSKNPEETSKSKIFISEYSISKNLSRLFGYKSEFIAKRLYYLMTGN